MLPAYFFVYLCTYGDNTDINYLLITTDTGVQFIPVLTPSKCLAGALQGPFG